MTKLNYTELMGGTNLNRQKISIFLLSLCLVIFVKPMQLFFLNKNIVFTSDSFWSTSVILFTQLKLYAVICV